MFGKVEVLLSHEHTLAEEVLVDLLAIGLGNEPATPYQFGGISLCREESSHFGKIF